MHWFINPIRYHYVDFKGRVGRKEFWMFVLFCVILHFIVEATGSMLFYSIYFYSLLLPGLAITARRLHDIGKSGWWSTLPFAIIAGTMSFLWLVSIIADNETASMLSVLLIIPFMFGGPILALLALYFLSKPSRPETNVYGPVPGVATDTNALNNTTFSFAPKSIGEEATHSTTSSESTTER